MSKLREKWIQNVESWNGCKLHLKFPMICSAHFERSIIKAWDTKCVLFEFAVPTLHSPPIVRYVQKAVDSEPFSDGQRAGGYISADEILSLASSDNDQGLIHNNYFFFNYL